jgi:hypothetical protein
MCSFQYIGVIKDIEDARGSHAPDDGQPSCPDFEPAGSKLGLEPE